MSTKGKGIAVTLESKEASSSITVQVVTMQQPLAIQKPKPFSGKEEDVELFILQLRSTFQLQSDWFSDNKTRAVYTMSLMEGKAQDWAKAHLKEYYKYKDVED